MFLAKAARPAAAGPQPGAAAAGGEAALPGSMMVDAEARVRRKVHGTALQAQTGLRDSRLFTSGPDPPRAADRRWPKKSTRTTAVCARRSRCTRRGLVQADGAQYRGSRRSRRSEYGCGRSSMGLPGSPGRLGGCGLPGKGPSTLQGSTARERRTSTQASRASEARTPPRDVASQRAAVSFR